MYLLDTNVLFEMRRWDKAHPRVAAWVASVDGTEMYLSAVTIMEIEIGALLMERCDQAQGRILRTWISERVLPSFVGRIIPFDERVAQLCARLHVPDPRSERDAMIGATAIVHGMRVVTRNVADFEPMGAAIIDPWGEEARR